MQTPKTPFDSVRLGKFVCKMVPVRAQAIAKPVLPMPERFRVKFRVSGFGIQGSGFGIQGSGFRFQVSGVGVWVSDFGSRVSGLGFGLWVLGFGFRVSGFEFRVSGFRLWASGCWFLVSGFWFLVSGFGFRVSGFGFRAATQHLDGNKRSVRKPAASTSQFDRLQASSQLSGSRALRDRAAVSSCSPKPYTSNPAGNQSKLFGIGSRLEDRLVGENQQSEPHNLRAFPSRV